MRILSAIGLVAFFLASVGCEVIRQPAQQGEWSDFHNEKAKVSADARPAPEKPAENPAEK